MGRKIQTPGTQAVVVLPSTPDARSHSSPALYRFVLVLEHLDALCPASGGGDGSAAALEVQVVATVCRRIDRLGLPSARHAGFIIATSSRPGAIHPAVRYGAHLDLLTLHLTVALATLLPRAPFSPRPGAHLLIPHPIPTRSPSLQAGTGGSG